MKLAWATDVHLNFLADDELETFCEILAATGADAILLGGDIAEFPSLEVYLERVEERLGRPIYFVLGNHDAYFGTIEDTRGLARRLTERSRHLRWLPASGVLELTPRTALIGVDGWADGRAGLGVRTTIRLNDQNYVGEFLGMGQPEVFAKLGALGDEAAALARKLLPAALDAREQVIFLTHVPPFREACWHEGQISDDAWLPHFTCLALGDACREIMAGRPDRTLTILCGHTHGAGEVDVLPNLKVITGAAEYGHPTVARVVELL